MATTSQASNLVSLNNHLNNKISEILFDNPTSISPLSLSYCLIPILYGAKGKTQNQLAAVFGLSPESMDIIRNKLIFEDLISLKKSFPENIKIVTGIYIRNNFPLQSDFKNIMLAAGHLEQVDFQDPETMPRINRFIAENTNNLIQKLLPEPNQDPNIAVVLVNTLYFNYKWQTAFNKYGDKFRNSKSQIKPMDFLYVEKSVPYFEDNNLQHIKIPYEKDFHMGIILPKNNYKLSTDLIDKSSKLVRMASVDIHIPKFTHKSGRLSLKPVLQKLGVQDLFDEYKSDLSGISETEIYVSEIYHEVVVIVDELRTEAAAATAALIYSRGCAVTEISYKFLADHNFLYYIRHNYTGTILFSGIYDGQ